MPTINPTSAHSVQSQAEKARDRRRRRWERARAVWRLGDWIARTSEAGWTAVPFARTAGCGRVVTAESGRVQIRSKLTDHGSTAYASGVMVCGSVWACPTCAAKIKTRRGLELSLAAERHIAAGGTIGILTLTIRHERSHELEHLVDGLGTAWRNLQATSAWQDVRRPVIGYRTTVSKNGRTYRRKVRRPDPVLHTAKSLEVNDGSANGWHPHLHILVFAESGADLDAVEAVAQSRWRSQVRSVLGPKCEPDDDHGVNMVKAPAGDEGAARTLARYISKFTAEVTRSDVKGSDALGVLLDGVEAGDVEAIARYVEFTRTMKGRRAVVFSDGLRAKYLADVEDLTDEEIAAQVEDGQVVAEIPRKEWLALCRAGTVPHALELVERGTFPERWRPPEDTPVRPPNRFVRRHRDRQVIGCAEVRL